MVKDMPGIHGQSQLADNYTGDSPRARRRRLLNVLKSFRLNEGDFTERYGVDTHLFSFGEGSSLTITDKKTHLKIGEVINKKPRKIKVVYGLEPNVAVLPEERDSQLKKQIESALRFIEYLEERKVSYTEEPPREELSKKFSGLSNYFKDLARKLE